MSAYSSHLKLKIIIFLGDTNFQCSYIQITNVKTFISNAMLNFADKLHVHVLSEEEWRW